MGNTAAWLASVSLVILFAGKATAQETDGTGSEQGFWARWFQRSDRTKAEQPHWITPLATTTPRLEQEIRYDIVWQQANARAPYSVNYGNSKGLELIPIDKLEVIAGIPPYLVHNNPALNDGLGDFRVLVKYRLLSANEERGNYIVTAFMDVSFPTGSPGNGQPNMIVTPTMAYGKGIGHFDVQGTFALAIPVGNEDRIGRTYISNNTIQYQLFRKLWPELEVNASFFQDGKNDGTTQVFVTPGIIVGRIPLNDRLTLTVGAGVQIAVSEFHTSTHNIIVSVRLPF